MKKRYLFLLSLFCLLFVGCSTQSLRGSVTNETIIKEKREYSTQEILSLLRKNAEGWALKFRNNQVPMDQEGYYRLSNEEQKDLFFLQHESVNRYFYIPKFSYMEVEVMSGAYCVIQEDEGLFPLSYEGVLDFYSTKIRYPFSLITKFFKGFSLHGVVEVGEINVEIIGKYNNSDSEGNLEEKKTFLYRAGDSFEINPWNDFSSKNSIKQFDIYITGKEDSKLNYNFNFRDNS